MSETERCRKSENNLVLPMLCGILLELFCGSLWLHSMEEWISSSSMLSIAGLEFKQSKHIQLKKYCYLISWSLR